MYVGIIGCVMSVSTVLSCGEAAVSLGEKYVFVTVMCLVLPMCILISCSSVLCVLMALVCLYL